MTASRHALTFLSSPEFDAKLDELGAATGRRAKSDVLRDAVELYDLVVRRVKARDQVYIGARPETADLVAMFRVAVDAKASDA